MWRRKKTEKPIEKATVNYAKKKYGVEGIKMNGAGRNHRPDRLFLFDIGMVLWIEFKRPDEEPTPPQRAEAIKLRKKGYQVESCDNEELGRQIIDRFAAIVSATKTLAPARIPKASSVAWSKSRLSSDMG